MTETNTDGIKENDIMKYLKYTYWLLAALMVSCSVQETEVPVPVTEDEDVEFYASIEGEPSRAYVDERLLVLWNADDRVSIFNKTTFNQEYAFTGDDGDNSGTFAKVPNENFLTANPLDLVYSVYPYMESTKISNDGTLTVDLPAKQSYRENSFGKGANTMIAISRDNELMFKNLCGYLTTVNSLLEVPQLQRTWILYLPWFSMPLKPRKRSRWSSMNR